MQVSMEMLIIEGRVSTQILAETFSQFRKWVTHKWLQLVWGKIDMCDFWVEILGLPLELPHKGNCWIMLAFIQLEFTSEELIRLNLFHCNQHVTFKSDVFNASGWALDKQYFR
jgi:hypothetical protein